MTRAADLARREAELARYYDLDMLDVRDDIGMYRSLAGETDGPVLELAVGSGRVAVALASDGHRVVGVDPDAAMLTRARAAWQAARGTAPSSRLRVVEADMTSFRSAQRFGLAILALNGLLLLPDDAARKAALTTMRIHLRPGGLAVVDVSLPDAVELATSDGRLQLEWVRTDPETGDIVTKSMSARYDPDVGSVELTQIFDAVPFAGGSVRRLVRTDVLSLVGAAELRDLAARAGFGDIDLRGDHRLTPLGPRSPRAVLLARLV